MCASYLYLNLCHVTNCQNHATSPSDHLLILHFSIAGLIVTPCLPRLISNETEVDEGEDQLLGKDTRKRKGTKRKMGTDIKLH